MYRNGAHPILDPALKLCRLKSWAHYHLWLGVIPMTVGRSLSSGPCPQGIPMVTGRNPSSGPCPQVIPKTAKPRPKLRARLLLALELGPQGLIRVVAAYWLRWDMVRCSCHRQNKPCIKCEVMHTNPVCNRYVKWREDACTVVTCANITHAMKGCESSSGMVDYHASWPGPQPFHAFFHLKLIGGSRGHLQCFRLLFQTLHAHSECTLKVYICSVKKV